MDEVGDGVEFDVLCRELSYSLCSVNYSKGHSLSSVSTRGVLNDRLALLNFYTGATQSIDRVSEFGKPSSPGCSGEPSPITEGTDRNETTDYRRSQ